jgi:hypothetical protein
MKRKINKLKFLFLSWMLFPCAVVAQGTAPFWIDADVRNVQYPVNTYYTGFAEVSVAVGEGQKKALNRAKQVAIGELSERVRVAVNSKKESTDISIGGIDIEEKIYSTFVADVKTASHTEMVGVKTETWFDAKKNIVYAFAYVNKYELADYYKANISMLLQQAEGNLATAEQLEQNAEKIKARKQCEDVAPLFAKIRYAQDLLTAIDAADSEGLQQTKSEDLRNKATQMLARLAQGVYVYAESSEENFGKKETIIVNQLKAILANRGCSFTDNSAEADFKLRINASTRTNSGNQTDIVFCYADVQVELYDTHKQKVVFNDEFSQKGGAATNERAGKKALEEAVPKVAEKLEPWIGK